MNLKEASQRAHAAERSLRSLSLTDRNSVLLGFADFLEQDIPHILSENKADLYDAKAAGMSEAKLDRLMLDTDRIHQIAEGIRRTASLPDPLNRVLEERTFVSGIHLKKSSTPIGVIGIIFESRPNVSADCAALCFKSGNACILKGGKESLRSCAAIIQAMHSALKQYGIGEDAVLLAENPSHEEVEAFISDRSSLDLLIPRGGRQLIESVVSNAKVPVIETGAGVCHIYVEKTADPDMAERIIINAKCQRPSVCNSMETLLVEEDIAFSFIPRIAESLKKHNVIIYGDGKSCSLAPDIRRADESSWYTGYNDLIMNLKVVQNTQEALDHIEKYGTHHSESIISEDEKEVHAFMTSIDSACLYHNASTRFTDGFEFGLGAEIGISTQKLHARGPMGLNELTSYTYYLEGNGEIRK